MSSFVKLALNQSPNPFFTKCPAKSLPPNGAPLLGQTSHTFPLLSTLIDRAPVSQAQPENPDKPIVKSSGKPSLPNIAGGPAENGTKPLGPILSAIIVSP